MTNTSLFSTTQTEEKTYPTPSEIFNKLIEVATQLQKDNHVIFQEMKKQYELTGLSYNEEVLWNVIKEDDAEDIDEIVYDVISKWDEKFEGDTDWCDEDDSDEKDSLRDFVMNIIEEEEASLLDINADFLKRESVQKELKNYN